MEPLTVSRMLNTAQHKHHPSTRPPSFRLGARAPWISLVVLVSTFTAGWVAAQTAFATRINRGLVTAFNSVGQNLFGSAVFGARVVPPNPGFPSDTVQLDVADDTRLPLLLNVFTPSPLQPGDPCRTYVQVAIGEGGDGGGGPRCGAGGLPGGARGGQVAGGFYAPSGAVHRQPGHGGLTGQEA